MTLEYFCVSCDAGPWSEDAKGGDGKSIVSLHKKLKHNVEVFNEEKHTSKSPGDLTDTINHFIDFLEWFVRKNPPTNQPEPITVKKKKVWY